jgi:hypothetical protein
VVGPQSCCADAAFNDMLRDATKMRQMLYRQTSDKIKLQQSVVISQGLYPHLAALGLARKTPAAARQRARRAGQRSVTAGDGWRSASGETQRMRARTARKQETGGTSGSGDRRDLRLKQKTGGTSSSGAGAGAGAPEWDAGMQGCKGARDAGVVLPKIPSALPHQDLDDGSPQGRDRWAGRGGSACNSWYRGVVKVCVSVRTDVVIINMVSGGD